MSERIIIVRPDRLGDVILSSACLLPLREVFSDASIYFATQPAYHPLYQSCNVIDGVWDASMCEDVLVTKMKSHEISIMVCLHPSKCFERAAQRAGVGIRLGFVEKKGNGELLTHPILSRKARGLKHESAYSFDLLEALEVSCPDVLVPFCKPDRRAKEKVDALMGAGKLALRFAVLHLGAHGDKPRLPVYYFLAVAEALFRLRVQVVLVGTDQRDGQLCEFLEEVSAPEGMLLNLVGELALDEVAWLLNEASVYFSRDTGPAHLAAAMKCPTVTVIPNPTKKTRARRWRPLGASSICIEKNYFHFDFENKFRLARRHLKKVSHDEVVDAVLTVMREY